MLNLYFSEVIIAQRRYLVAVQLGYFVATSFRAISLLLNIMFHNEKAIDPKQEIYESNEEKKARYTRLKPTDTQNNKTQRD